MSLKMSSKQADTVDGLHAADLVAKAAYTGKGAMLAATAASTPAVIAPTFPGHEGMALVARTAQAGGWTLEAPAPATHGHVVPYVMDFAHSNCRYIVPSQVDVIFAPGYGSSTRWLLNPDDGSAYNRVLFPITRAGTIKKVTWSISAFANLDATNFYKAVVYKNGVATSFSYTFNGATIIGSMTADLAVAVNDKLDVRLLATTALGAAERDLYNLVVVADILYAE